MNYSAHRLLYYEFFRCLVEIFRCAGQDKRNALEVHISTAIEIRTRYLSVRVDLKSIAIAVGNRRPT
jgi:hypothetical protein